MKRTTALMAPLKRTRGSRHKAKKSENWKLLFLALNINGVLLVMLDKAKLGARLFHHHLCTFRACRCHRRT